MLVDELIGEGHSPTHFARQLVRFLRNVTVAKIAGKDSALLQISSDERARVGRIAELFSEEELTRHLQIMLRTHGELGYRQEQRFHLELGLLKMAHAQTLVADRAIAQRCGSIARQRLRGQRWYVTWRAPRKFDVASPLRRRDRIQCRPSRPIRRAKSLPRSEASGEPAAIADKSSVTESNRDPVRRTRLMDQRECRHHGIGCARGRRDSTRAAFRAHDRRSSAARTNRACTHHSRTRHVRKHPCRDGACPV